MIDTTATGWPSMRPGGNWSAEYRHVRRLLFGALSRLAIEGYAVPPSEGLDLVHDFLLEAWDGLSERYDPAKGARDTYVYAAFVRFARPRIARLRRLRMGLSAPAEIAALSDSGAQVDADSRRAEAASAWAALERQPTPHRDLLAVFLSDEKPTERQLAADFGLTRHAMRLRLADAVGRAALALSGTADFPEEDRAVAVALWRDDRTVKEAADLLQISVGRVNGVRQRVFARLADASRSIPSRRRKVMNKSMRKPAVSELLVSALRPGATKREMLALAEHRDEVLNWLDEHVEDLPLRAMPGPEQLAQVYAALGGEPPAGADDPFRAPRDGDDAAVGEAFAEVLLPNLSEALRHVETWFAGVATMDADGAAALREEPIVAAGGETARRLAAYGVTPVTVAVACQALAALAARRAETAGLVLGGVLVWEVAEGREHPEPGRALLSRACCVQEVGLATELPDDAAAGLHGWLGAVAAYAPRLLDGFDAASRGPDAVALTRTDRFTTDLRQRWRGPDPEPEHVAVAAE